MDNKNFENFIAEVTGKIKEYLPTSFEDCSIDVKSVPKNNGLILTGICVKKDNSHIAPVVYLDELFKRYEEGCPIGDILEIVAKRCSQCVETNKFLTSDIVSSFESAKDRIFPCLINKEWNKELLKETIHTDFLDLAVTYKILINECADGTASTTIDRTLFERWDVSVEKLHQTALDNMMRDTPCEFKTMIEVLTDLTGDPLPDDLVPDDMMWILTNSNKINGAASILDEDMLKFIQKHIGNFYLLPSSIFEVIIVRDQNIDPASLKTMVLSVNATEVNIDQRLSESVYYFDAEEGLKIVA